ncbi:MAG: septum formation initiator [Parcubacteria group bacterium Gr01-1014_13]|nr:MAG: septum formation initiator [Parcubacteria group bacterium Gr01-1014_13]
MPSAKESGWKNFFGSRLFLLVATIIAIMVIFGYGRAYYQDYLVTQEIESLQDQAKSLEAKKMELLEVLKYVKSDSFAEEKARTELNMVKPGEQVLVVPKTAEKDNRQENSTVVGFSSISNYKKWWQYFFN